jgi:hypothetical protein
MSEKSFDDIVVEISLAIYNLYPEKLEYLEKDLSLLNKIEDLAYIVAKRYNNPLPIQTEKERIEQEEDLFRRYDDDGDAE